MNYYPFHLGDYAAHTGHLEPMEDLAYRRLLDLYYIREAPLPADIQTTAKLVRMRSCAADVESVLREFFTLADEGWRHSRCDEEIEKMQSKQAKARASAAASVNARRAKAEQQTNASSTDAERSLPNDEANAERSLLKTSTEVELPTPTPTPTPVLIEPNGSVGSADRLPRCETQSVVDLYHDTLPELPRVRLMTDGRRKAISAFWRFVLTSKKSDGSPRATNADEAMAWIRGYFGRARDNDFLMGRGHKAPGHEGWSCDLDFLLTDKGKRHVIEKTKEAA